mmetsp:Transcript_21116/g.31851  ORF Transcript_21116/g.31851 Transcript_21116/m.31851 type:complete len:205 (-) Transcript_21116:378-992(-)
MESDRGSAARRSPSSGTASSGWKATSTAIPSSSRSHPPLRKRMYSMAPGATGFPRASRRTGSHSSQRVCALAAFRRGGGARVQAGRRLSSSSRAMRRRFSASRRSSSCRNRRRSYSRCRAAWRASSSRRRRSFSRCTWNSSSIRASRSWGCSMSSTSRSSTSPPGSNPPYTKTRRPALAAASPNRGAGAAATCACSSISACSLH